MTRGKSIFALALAAALLGAGPASALDVRFTVRPEQITLGQAARIEFTVEGAVSSFDPGLGNIPGLSVSGPQIVQNSQMVNRRTRNFTVYTYTAVPRNTGDFTIGPFDFTDDTGQKKVLDAVTLKVLAPGDTPSARGGSASLQDLVRLEVSVSKASVFPQEVFEVTFQLLYRRINLSDEFQLHDFNIPGLEVETPVRVASAREERDGEVWNAMRWRAKARAQRPGAFSLSPTLSVGILTDAGGRSDMFFPRARAGATVDVTASPVPLECVELPVEGLPASFSGAIGQFEFRAGIKPGQVAQGDPVTLTMVIVGSGNHDSISAPVLPDDPLIRRYDPKLVASDRDASTGRGRKGYEQVLLPMETGVKEIPAVEFSYFDPVEGKYQVVRQGPFPITVTASADGGTRVVGQTPGGGIPSATERLGADIEYLKPIAAPALSPRRTPWFLRPVAMGLQAVPLLAALIAWRIARRRDRLAGDLSATRRIRAPRAARAALGRAVSELAGGTPEAAMLSLQTAIRDYTANRFNMGLGEVSGEVIRARFSTLDPALADELAGIFDACETARYAGAGTTPADVPALLRETRRLLSRLEGMRS